ncbi:MAG: hypothetical protein ACRD15_17980 [Vicinamibacterales bacterium]
MHESFAGTGTSTLNLSSAANVRNVAFTGRAEYAGIPDFTIGAASWTGESSFSLPGLDATVPVDEVDAIATPSSQARRSAG